MTTLLSTKLRRAGRVLVVAGLFYAPLASLRRRAVIAELTGACSVS